MKCITPNGIFTNFLNAHIYVIQTASQRKIVSIPLNSQSSTPTMFSIFHHRLILPILEFHMNEIIWHNFFCILLLSLKYVFEIY